MEQTIRLAVLDRGESAVRLLAAVGNLERAAAEPRVTSVIVVTEPRARAWYAREADESVDVAGPDGTVTIEAVVAALRSARTDAVWIGRVPCHDQLALVTECERAGIRVVGPDSGTISRLSDSDQIRAAARRAGIPVEPAGDDCASPPRRRLEVDVLADAVGTVWALGTRDVSVRRGEHLILAELPAPGLTDEAAGALLVAARTITRALGYQGAGVLEFTTGPDGTDPRLVRFDTVARAEHSLLEESTGSSFLRLRLAIAQGDLLIHTEPVIEGHAIEARLLAEDPERGFSATGGAVQLLVQPVGTGVRIDASLREGDVVDAALDPLVATFTAWGHSRAEALSRMCRAVERTLVVLSGGPTNRAALLTLLGRPEIIAGAVDADWWNRLAAGDEIDSTADPVAVVAAAVETYEADLALAQQAFLATAARGRPEHPEAVGTMVALDYRGVSHRLRIYRTGADRYRIHAGVVIDVQVDRPGPYERRIAVGGHRHRVLTVAQGAGFRLEIDGAAHTVERTDGFVVRAGWPALVARILVAPGDQVTTGDEVAVLESMKMVTTVTAPYAGVVTSVAVVANSQVERGAPLLRIRAEEGTDSDGEPASPGQQSTDAVGEGTGGLLSSLVAPEHADAGDPPLAEVFGRLTQYLLGYDRDPSEIGALLTRLRAESAQRPGDDGELTSLEDDFLELFAETASLYRPRTEAADEIEANTQEYLIDFLTDLDADRAGLPEGYRARLERALGRYGVVGLRRGRALEAAVTWLFRSFARVPALVPAVTTILDRRLTHVAALRPGADQDLRTRMDRLARATEGRQQPVADLARDVVFHYLDAPLLDTVRAEVEAEMSERLEALGRADGRADREEHITALVACPHPLRALMLRAWLDSESDPGLRGFRFDVLEAYARRFYRIRDLQRLQAHDMSGLQVVTAEYAHDGTAFHLVVAHVPWAELASVPGALAEHLGGLAPAREVVVDLVLWRDGDRPSIEDLAEQATGVLAECDFGRPLHRLDLTVTSLGQREEGVVGSAGASGTQHLTFRSGSSGLTEDLVYRNLHPMLAKRLELWRLSNFELTRLPSPEDVYLFSGVARDNPRDHRLFALAEVRDLLRVTDPSTGAADYPGLGRMGLRALAAMRDALAAYPPRQRPAANRLVLWVRPTWTIPRTELPALAAAYEPLARNAGLEKLVLHIKVPARDSRGRQVLVDQVIHVEGMGRSGTAIRVTEPGSNPVRPLTRYAQKLLTAARFGSPYPYEIIHMLTPGEDGTSAFPRGSFTELELVEAEDPGEDRLEPIVRPPAENTAHLVVGLLTSYTDAVPEGMTRVAILSDPTQGLGNLAEPECRRINAALAHAAAHRLPVEWYAVSSGALIAMDSGTENMDWIALTLRRIIEFTQGGGEINIIVTGINVGGQPYWNAEATMLMHTRGILIMTPASAMVLTGKQALDFSGAVSADDNFGIGGYDRVMGPNGQAQYWAPSFQDACLMLLRHYDYTYVVPGERFPRRRRSDDPFDRDVRRSPHADVPGVSFTTVGDIFDERANRERKRPFDMRSVMRAVSDDDCEPLERWRDWRDGDTSIVWDVTVGGIPVCMIGVESRSVPRQGAVPADGPPSWTSGTLFPQSSRKTARAINATSGNRPLVVLANLSGFDGSPESMRRRQLEYGAEIGRAVTNFRGPIVFVVVSRYHGGAFVVFSKALTATMEIAAVQGAYASVIGGAPAAATVFAREVKQRTERDERVSAATSGDRARIGEITAQVRSEKLGEVADEFDAIHTIERARRVGSVDEIIEAERLRPWIISAVERGMAREQADRSRA
jgi:acetyl/propionyl-CoA carboxylase alpha subunit/acetyl-CoA carboxylase carboxyltransferase component